MRALRGAPPPALRGAPRRLSGARLSGSSKQSEREGGQAPRRRRSSMLSLGEETMAVLLPAVVDAAVAWPCGTHAVRVLSNFLLRVLQSLTPLLRFVPVCRFCALAFPLSGRSL